MRGSADWPAVWFSQDPAARLIVGRDLTVYLANKPALGLIDGNGALGLRDGVLSARNRKSAADLAGIIAVGGVGVVAGEGGSGVLIEALALGDQDSPVALTLRDLNAAVEIECAELESMFGVTPGERQVIVQLLKGFSSRDIAEQTRKSILTVRTHVKRAYGKIGVKTRGQLFARLLPYLVIR